MARHSNAGCQRTAPSGTRCRLCRRKCLTQDSPLPAKNHSERFRRPPLGRPTLNSQHLRRPAYHAPRSPRTKARSPEMPRSIDLKTNQATASTATVSDQKSPEIAVFPAVGATRFELATSTSRKKADLLNSDCFVPRFTALYSLATVSQVSAFVCRQSRYFAHNQPFVGRPKR